MVDLKLFDSTTDPHAYWWTPSKQVGLQEVTDWNAPGWPVTRSFRGSTFAVGVKGPGAFGLGPTSGSVPALPAPQDGSSFHGLFGQSVVALSDTLAIAFLRYQTAIYGFDPLGGQPPLYLPTHRNFLSGYTLACCLRWVENSLTVSSSWTVFGNMVVLDGYSTGATTCVLLSMYDNDDLPAHGVADYYLSTASVGSNDAIAFDPVGVSPLAAIAMGPPLGPHFAGHAVDGDAVTLVWSHNGVVSHESASWGSSTEVIRDGYMSGSAPMLLRSDLAAWIAVESSGYYLHRSDGTHHRKDHVSDAECQLGRWGPMVPDGTMTIVAGEYAATARITNAIDPLNWLYDWTRIVTVGTVITS